MEPVGLLPLIVPHIELAYSVAMLAIGRCDAIGDA